MTNILPRTGGQMAKLYNSEKSSEQIIQDKLQDLVLSCKMNPMNERNLIKDFCTNNFVVSCGQFMTDDVLEKHLSGKKMNEVIENETNSALCRIAMNLQDGIYKKNLIEHSVRKERFGSVQQTVHDIRLFVMRLK